MGRATRNDVLDTSERLAPGRQTSLRQHLMLLRHQFAYHWASEQLGDPEDLLEVGCGEGYGSAILAKRALRYVGVDVDEAVVRHAAAEHPAANAEFRHYDGRRLPFDDASFHAIASFQVIEHVEEDRGFLGELVRVLRPGGVAILTTPNRVLRLTSGQRPWNRHHVREYAASDFAAILGESFERVRVFGLRGGEEVERQERERLGAIRRMVRLDFLGLRDSLPEGLRQWVVSQVERRRRLPDPEEEARARARFGLGDFSAVEDDLDASLDLLAIARKRA